MKNTAIKKSLKTAIVLTLLFFMIEIIGALISGSLSLFGDAGHMFRDVVALLISFGAVNIAGKLPAKTKTFGYHRIEIFAALMNGILLLGISGWILIEAYQRLLAPHPIQSITMFMVALLGLLINLYVAFKLHGSHDLNVKSAFIHVFTDTLSSVAVIFASVWIFYTKQTIVDPILGMGIALFILFSAFTIIRDSVHILLEFAPKHINPDEIISVIESVKGVNGIHNMHLWSLCSNINIIDAHIYTHEPDMGKIEMIKKEIKQKLEKYDIKHATFEFECEECLANNIICQVDH